MNGVRCGVERGESRRCLDRLRRQKRKVKILLFIVKGG